MWLPPGVTQEMAAEREMHTAAAIEQMELGAELREWNRLLKEIDPHLQVVKASERATHPQLKAGFYHIIRTPPGVPPTVIVHETAEGGYQDLDSSLLERLRKGDMWSDRAMREKTDRDRKLQRAAEKQRERERAERQEELLDRMKAAWNPGVHIQHDTPKAG